MIYSRLNYTQFFIFNIDQSPTNNTVSSSSNNIPPTPQEVKLQTSTSKKQKKEAQFTTPLLKKTLLLSGIGICACIALFYHQQLRALSTNFYSTFQLS